MGDIILVEEYVITKNIAKHGNNSIIVIPRILRHKLQPRTTVKVTIEVIERPEACNASGDSIGGIHEIDKALNGTADGFADEVGKDA